MLLCNLAGGYHFRQTCCLNLQGRNDFYDASHHYTDVPYTTSHHAAPTPTQHLAGLDSKEVTVVTHLGFWKSGAQKPFQKSLLLRKKLSTNSLWPIHKVCIRFITVWYTGLVTTSGFCIVIVQ